MRVVAAAVLASTLATCWGHHAVEGAKSPDVEATMAASANAAPASSGASTDASAPLTSTSTSTSAIATVADASPPAPPVPELPLGGRVLFPDYRLIGFCGTPGAPALGQLDGNLPVKAKRMRAFADKFPTDRKPLLVFELIVVVVQSYAGADGKYRRRIDTSIIDQFLKATRESQGLLLLNIQPGQSDFMTEVQRFEPYLKEPDVGVALDPEWEVKAKQKPGVFYGQTTGAEINDVANYLAGIVKEGNLPEKALIFHQLNRYVVKDESTIAAPPGVVIIKSVDGLGPKHAKIVTYDDLMKVMAPGVHPGFKLFLEEDKRIGGHVMGPLEVMALKPQPEYVMVE